MSRTEMLMPVKSSPKQVNVSRSSKKQEDKGILFQDELNKDRSQGKIKNNNLEQKKVTDENEIDEQVVSDYKEDSDTINTNDTDNEETQNNSQKDSNNDVVDTDSKVNLDKDENLDFDANANITQLLEKLQDILSKENNDSLKRDVSKSLKLDLVSNTKNVDMSDQLIETKLKGILKKVKVLLQQADQENLQKVAPKLLQLLKQWSTLKNELGNRNESGMKNMIENLTTKDKSQITKMWTKLVNAYEKRTQMATKTPYGHDANVRKSDVVKWLKSILKKSDTKGISLHTQEKQVPVQLQDTGRAMSQVEQFVIYTGKHNTALSVEEDVIDQFKQVIKASKFMSFQNGKSQLSIQLMPENLGQLNVKLMKIDGQMTVKIIAASNAAKDMLQSNIHQLKHMFAPHQVTIERQDMQMQQTQSYQGEHEGHFEDGDGRQEQSSGDSESNDGNEKSEKPFTEHFRDILMGVGE